MIEEGESACSRSDYACRELALSRTNILTSASELAKIIGFHYCWSSQIKGSLGPCLTPVKSQDPAVSMMHIHLKLCRSLLFIYAVLSFFPSTFFGKVKLYF